MALRSFSSAGCSTGQTFSSKYCPSEAVWGASDTGVSTATRSRGAETPGRHFVQRDTPLPRASQEMESGKKARSSGGGTMGICGGLGGTLARGEGSEKMSGGEGAGGGARKAGLM